MLQPKHGTTMQDRRRYSIFDLVRLTGISRRNLYYYRDLGLISKAIGRGPTAYYTKHHLQQVARIQDHLQRRTRLRDLVRRDG